MNNKKVEPLRELLAFQDLTPEEKEKRGILGRLYGPCASITIPTRNGRFYSSEVWDNIFENDQIVDELFKNGGIPLELDHPTDREETCSDRIAAMLPEKPKRDKDGHLVCYCDIIDTPCGKIAYQLAKYGFKLGISSRGTGDIVVDDNGNEAVDPETYKFSAFDLVLIPAVKDARLSMVESLNQTKTLQEALTEELSKASASDRKLMQETLDNLNIDYQSEKSEDNIKTEEAVEEKQEGEEKANDNGVSELVKNLQEALMSKTQLEAKLLELQNELAVSDTKVEKLNEELDRYKKLSVRLSSTVKESKVQLESLLSLKEELQTLKKTIATNDETIKQLQEKLQIKQTNADVVLTEKLQRTEATLKTLQEDTNNFNSLKLSYEEQINGLQESLNMVKADNEKTVNGLTKKLQESNTSINNYKKIAYSTVNRYIDIRAEMLGVSSNEIKNKLNESYTLDDVDNICEEIQRQSINISKLPFNINRGTKIRVTESKNDPLCPHDDSDDVDELLLTLAGLK